MNVHVGRKLAERLVEVVHLCQDTHSRNDHEHIGRSMSELVVASKCQLQSNAKCFDSHDRDRSHEGADTEVDEWVMLPVDRSNLVNHKDGESRNRDRVYQEAWAQVSPSGNHEPGGGDLPGRKA